MTNKELLKITSRVGSMLIEYGAEIYRVEDSLNRIAFAYGFGTEEKHMEIFAIPTLLIVTLNDGDRLPISQTKRIVNRSTNLDRVDKLNNLSRYICTIKPEPEIIERHLDEISKRSVYGIPVQFMSFGVVGAVFALFFGGEFPDAIVAGVLSILIFFISKFVNKIKPSVFFQSVICYMVIASCAVII